MFVNSDKAIEAGLKFRSVKETVADTLTWWQSEAASEPLKSWFGS